MDVDLSPKRIECMKKSIVEESGKVIEFKDKIIEERVDYLLVNSKLPIPLVLKKIGDKINFKEILDYNFVLHCLREQVVLAISKYSLHRSRQIE